jgi:hypothetical protein
MIPRISKRLMDCKNMSDIFFGLNLESKCRKREYTEARHMFWAWSFSRIEPTLRQLGIVCGNRDHSTVIHGVRTHWQVHETDKYYRSVYKTYCDEMDGYLDGLGLENKSDLMIPDVTTYLKYSNGMRVNTTMIPTHVKKVLIKKAEELNITLSELVARTLIKEHILN